MPTITNPIMDERYHIELAGQINSDEGMAEEPFFRAPLYPYFLAAIYHASGNSLYRSRFVQIALGSFLPLLVLLLGLRLFNRPVAYWASVVAVIYPTFIYYDASLLITSLMTLLVTLLAWQLCRTQERPGLPNFLAAGLFLGLAALSRPNILLLGPVLFIWVWFTLKPRIGVGKAIRGYVVIGLAAILMILPVTIRNYAVSGDFVLIAWQGGYNFFVGNNREATGWSATVPGIDPSWQGGYQQSIAMAEAVEKRPLERSDVSDFWYRMAWQEIRHSPGRFVSLLFRKLRLFLNGYEIPNNQNIYLVRRFASVISPLMFAKAVYFPYGLVAPLAVIGIVLSLKQWRKYLVLYLLLGSYVTTLLLFFVCARFRQPLLPILLLFAVYGAYRGVEFIRLRSGKNLALMLFALALMLCESNHDLLALNPNSVEAEDMFVLGTSYAEQNDLARAESYYRRAIRADSTHARAVLNLGYVYSWRGQHAAAMRCYQRGIALEPTNPEAYFNYATTLQATGRLDGALRVLERAREILPLNSNIHVKLAAVYHQLGRMDDAKASVGKSLRLDPNNRLAVQMYEQLIGKQDR